VPEQVEALAGVSFDLDRDDAALLPALVWSDSVGAARVRLLARDGDQIVGVAVGSVVGTKGFLDLLAVAPELRRRGIASELIANWESRATALGAESLSIGANLHAYAWPGIDIRYTPAIATFLHVGYLRQNVLFNMDVDLPRVRPPDAAELSNIEKAGVAVRRGTMEDAGALARHTAKEWFEAWARETQIALRKPTPSIFLAIANDDVIGFAAHSVFRAAHFGPLGTAPAWRRIGLGGILTRLALADMAANGHRSGQIAWVNEAAIPFYSRCSNARLGRTFWTMTRRPPQGVS
jgi:GNAT superfamily N-acetyltransferase